MIKDILKLFFIVDVVIFIISYILFGQIVAINIQVAFFSSLFVTIGSYLGYKKNILNRVKNHKNYDDKYDEIDKLDDTFDLYSPDIEQNDIKELSKEDIKKIIKKNKPKGNNIKSFVGGLSGMASIYRIAGYVIIIIGFFYLKNNNILEPIYYLLGFLIVPLLALVYNAISAKSYREHYKLS
jgi:hypothetical protein